MARQDFSEHHLETASMPPEAYLALGQASICGRDGAPDRIEAHKWFNIAAARGCRDALPLRAEVAAEMSADEISRAQRAAREWLTLH